MECDKVSLCKELVKSLASCNAELIKLLLGNIRIVSDCVHAHALELSGYDRTDTAETDDTYCLAFELNTCPVAASEVAMVYAFVCCAKITEDGECMTYGKLTGCHVVSSRSIKCDNAMLCACLNIDVIDSCSGSADSLKTISVVKKGFIDLCC